MSRYPYRNDTYNDLLRKLVNNLSVDGAISFGPPRQPTGETTQVLNDTTVQITWNQTGTTTGTNVGIDLEEVLPPAEPPAIIVVTPPDTEVVVVPGLEPGQSYWYTLQPFNDNGVGPKTTPKPFTMTGTLSGNASDDFTGMADGTTTKAKQGTGWKGNGFFIGAGAVYGSDDFTGLSDGVITTVSTGTDFGASGTFFLAEDIVYVGLDDLQSYSNGLLANAIYGTYWGDDGDFNTPV